MLFQLASPVTFRKEIRPVCLPASPTVDYAGRRAVVSGWGTLSEGGQLSSTLQEVEVDVLRGCGGYPASYISDMMLCATRTGKDSCQGDSGGRKDR